MPKGLQRIYGQGRLHFVTFSCYHRLPLLRSASARGVFVQALDRVRKEYAFKLVGYVVMPEHVHLLLSEPARGTPSTVLKMLAHPEAQHWPKAPGGAALFSLRSARRRAPAVLAAPVL